MSAAEVWVLCVEAYHPGIGLTAGKRYRLLPHESGMLVDEHGSVRAVDDTDEDYLYSGTLFEPHQIPWSRNMPTDYGMQRVGRCSGPPKK